MKIYRINEDALPQKMPVRFSAKVTSKIDSIISRNQNDKQAISRWLEYLETIKNYVSNPVIAWDYTDRNIKFPNGTRYIRDFDFNIGYSIITDYATNAPFVYIFMVNLNHQEYGLKENKHRDKAIIITESYIRSMVRECISRILQEDRRKPTLGEYEVVDGFFRSCIAPSLKQFGAYNDIRMYYSPSHTYCLLRREDNGTLFFAEIVDAPELGRDETKFAPRKPSEVPAILLRDAQSLLRKAKNQRTLLS